MLILASKSPRREEILRNAGYSFEIVPSNSDEIIEGCASALDAAVSIACAKANDVHAKYPADTVVGADTIVFLDDMIMGKPKDYDDAVRMLSTLSGRVHEVVTGVCVISGDRSEYFYEVTQVEFYTLSDTEIHDYIMTGEPFDKAGAYGIQEKGAVLVKKINGDFFNVMGLPIARLSRILGRKDCYHV